MKELWTPDSKLHLPPPLLIGFWLEVGAWDAKGRLFHRERTYSRSPVKQLLQILLAGMQFSSVTGIMDTAGVSRSMVNCNISAADYTPKEKEGVIIGTDNTPVDITDYQLGSIIVNGTSAGQMLYGAKNYDANVTVADPDCTFDTWRNYNNNSGGSITVKETGIAARYQVQVYFFLICRDVPTEIIVPNGGGCYVKYTLKITE